MSLSTVVSGRRVCPLWHEMNKVHPALTICVGISCQWFPLCFQRHHPTTWPVPVMGSLHLLPLQGGYSSHHRCDERLEVLDTHHAFTLDSHGFPLLGHIVRHAPSTSLTNNRLRRHMPPQSPGVLWLFSVRQVSGSVVGDHPRQDMLFYPSDCSITGNSR